MNTNPPTGRVVAPETNDALLATDSGRTQLADPLVITVGGHLARQLRETASDLGWSVSDLVGHVLGDLSELASRGLLVGDDSADNEPYDPTFDGTTFSVANAR